MSNTAWPNPSFVMRGSALGKFGAPRRGPARNAWKGSTTKATSSPSFISHGIGHVASSSNQWPPM